MHSQSHNISHLCLLPSTPFTPGWGEAVVYRRICPTPPCRDRDLNPRPCVHESSILSTRPRHPQLHHWLESNDNTMLRGNSCNFKQGELFFHKILSTYFPYAFHNRVLAMEWLTWKWNASEAIESRNSGFLPQSFIRSLLTILYMNFSEERNKPNGRSSGVVAFDYYFFFFFWSFSCLFILGTF